MHYRRWRNNGDALKVKVKQNHKRSSLCTVEDCNTKHIALGYCEKHYRRFKRHGDPLVTKKTPNGKYTGCKVSECDNPHFAKGKCEKHHRRDIYRKNPTVREKALYYSRKRKALRRDAMTNDFTSEDWELVLLEFESVCAYCGCSEHIQQEHVIPISRGGSHTKSNIIPACRSCNYKKKAKRLELWYPSQDFYDKEKEVKIFNWMGYKIENEKIQMKLF